MTQVLQNLTDSDSVTHIQSYKTNYNCSFPGTRSFLNVRWEERHVFNDISYIYWVVYSFLYLFFIGAVSVLRSRRRTSKRPEMHLKEGLVKHFFCCICRKSHQQSINKRKTSVWAHHLYFWEQFKFQSCSRNNSSDPMISTRCGSIRLGSVTVAYLLQRFGPFLSRYVGLPRCSSFYLTVKDFTDFIHKPLIITPSNLWGIIRWFFRHELTA